MAENNLTPASTPAPAGQAPDNNKPAGTPGANPAPANNIAPAGTDPQGQAVVEGKDGLHLTIEQINDLKRKAGRWDAFNERNRQTRREQRRSKDDYKPDDNTDPAILDTLKERDNKIDELFSANLKLQVKEKAREILESEEYKDIPVAVKKAIIRNPIGFTNPNSDNAEDMVSDIQDYLDDEADRMASDLSQLSGVVPPQNQSAGQGNPAANQNPNAIQTPPASGSGPASPNVDLNEGIGNKVGPARSTSVLRNLLKTR